MAAKPTQDPKWVTTDDPQHIIEPTAAFKANGVQSGGVWGREYLNWMFNAISKWIDWVRSYALDKDSNLNDLSDKAQGFNNIKQDATDSYKGVVELATGVEVQAGTDNTRAVTPNSLGALIANTNRNGLITIATGAEVLAGTDNTKAVTPQTLFQRTATTTRTGLVELATDAEALDNAQTFRVLTPSTLNARQATTSLRGVVEKATSGEMDAGEEDKFPDASLIKQYVDNEIKARTVGWRLENPTPFHVKDFNTNYSIRGCHISTDGTKFYVMDINAHILRQYTLNTPYDVGSAVYSKGFAYQTQTITEGGFTFSRDGLNLYIMSHSGTVLRYVLGTAYEVNTATYTSSYNSPVASTGRDIAISPDGTQMYLAQRDSFKIWQVTLSTPYDITTASYTGDFTAFSARECNSLAVSPDGTKFVVGTPESDDRVVLYTMNTPFTIASATGGTVYNINTEVNNIYGMDFSDNGANMYVADGIGGFVNQYNTGYFNGF